MLQTRAVRISMSSACGTPRVLNYSMGVELPILISPSLAPCYHAKTVNSDRQHHFCVLLQL